MKYQSVLVSTVLLILSIAGGSANGAPLTKQQLLNMKAAGISQDVIIAQIKSNGIAFPADPDTTIALKKAGLSDAVLNALVTAQTGSVAASPAQSATPEKPPSAQPQLDPCVPWQQDYEKLYKEDDAISTACDQVASNKSGAHAHDTFAEDCPIANCSARKRLINFQNPNKCPNPHSDIIFTDNCEPYDGYGKIDNTPNSFVVYHLVQTLQPNDSRYSCAQLKVLAYELEYAMADIDKSIKKATGNSQALNNQAQTSSQMAQLASALGGKGAPMTTAVSQLDSSIASQAAGNAQQQAASVQQIRDSQQKRHDYLMQIYFQKQCND